MYIHPMFPLWRTSMFEFPELTMRGSSSYKYEEDNDVITYTITVPENVSEEDIVASVKDGVLTLKLPKAIDKPADGSIKINRGGS